MSNRVVIVQQAYYQPKEGNTSSDSTQFSRFCETDADPYVRRAKVGREWIKLDRGWMEEASCLLIANPAPKYPKIPTEEQKRLDAERVIEISFSPEDSSRVADILVRPGESHRFEPAYLDRVWVRSASDSGSYTVTLYPR